MSTRLPDFVNHLQAQYGVAGIAGLALVAVVFLVIAVKVTKLVVQLICWILVALTLALAALWIYSHFYPGRFYPGASHAAYPSERHAMASPSSAPRFD